MDVRSKSQHPQFSDASKVVSGTTQKLLEGSPPPKVIPLAYATLRNAESCY